ncbi:hypothetical protein H0E87_010067 [Populus deltoides]|uniref:Phototropic-responsive NPH3 family protein n=1 Tax=Populus deltoides TaxID=3696 RepID=A0A8T2YRY0_POPDE|nr:hypothetical protein H0E87_010067 [Populus deltoides]
MRCVEERRSRIGSCEPRELEDKWRKWEVAEAELQVKLIMPAQLLRLQIKLLEAVKIDHYFADDKIDQAGTAHLTVLPCQPQTRVSHLWPCPTVSSLMSSPLNVQAHSNNVMQLHCNHEEVPSTSSITELRERFWFVNSQIPTDLSIQVRGITFTVHKYPFVSKSSYIGRLELQPSISNFGYELKLENFPGGPEAFEIILKFCYGLTLDLNPSNIAPLRCASEFLEMSEELDDGNLISKTEAFLTFVVLSSWKDTITVLKSCETLSPWAENLQIVRRCCDSIAWKASRDNSTIGDMVSDEGCWFDDVASLRIDHFMRIITAVGARGTKPEIIGKCIMQYAERWLPGMDVELEGPRGYGYGKNELQFSILIGRKEDEGIEHSQEQKSIIETLVSILPPQPGAVPCKFLLKMLKMAMVYSASQALISELEKRVGMMLENANVNDLLIPNDKREDQGKFVNSLEQRTMHDIEVIQRIVEYFLMHEKERQQLPQTTGKSSVSKLLDSYLTEVAKDPNLSITKFQVLAEALPEKARTCDDGLYGAIDTYLKAHPLLSEHDRKRLCRIMNCGKLSLDACSHAAQNDRLPLRTVIQSLNQNP